MSKKKRRKKKWVDSKMNKKKLVYVLHFKTITVVRLLRATDLSVFMKVSERLPG